MDSSSMSIYRGPTVPISPYRPDRRPKRSQAPVLQLPSASDLEDKLTFVNRVPFEDWRQKIRCYRYCYFVGVDVPFHGRDFEIAFLKRAEDQERVKKVKESKNLRFPLEAARSEPLARGPLTIGSNALNSSYDVWLMHLPAFSYSL